MFESRHLRSAFFRVLIGDHGIDRGMMGKANPWLKANVAELVNAAVLKTVDSLKKGSGGSNPSVSVDCEVQIWKLITMP